MVMEGVHETTPMAMDGSDPDDDDVSVYSAISNASEFEDVEEIEYLAMDLVNHLPLEKASKLLKNMKTKEKAVQDLSHRNRSLLDSCQNLVEENQALSVRLQDAETQAAAAPAALVQQQQQQQQQRRREENKKRIHAAFQSLLKDDMARMERWGSDIAALLLAVDGLEAQMRPGGKDEAAAKKGEAVQNSSYSASSERLTELSTQVLDDFDALRGQLENTEKLQLSLEQTARGVHDGADATVGAMDLDSSLAGAEREAACIQEHAQRAGGLNLRPTAELLGRTEATLDTLLIDAPPGLIPPLSEARGQISQLRRQLDEQIQMLAELQDGSASRAQSLQAALRAHREQFSRKVAEELQRSAAAFEQPLQHMRGGLMQQSEAVMRARGRVSGALEELAAAARRSAADGSLVGAEPPQATGAGNEELLGGIRDVRSMGRSLISGLEERGRALEGKFLKLYAALVGEAGLAWRSHAGGARQPRLSSSTAAPAQPPLQPTESARREGDEQGDAAEEIVIRLERCAESNQKLGLDVATRKTPPGLKVKHIRPGMIEEWNKTTDTHRLMPLDVIVCINGRDTVAGMVKALSEESVLELKVKKGGA